MRFFNIMQNHMIYIQNFTMIKSTDVRILSPCTGGIPNPTYKTLIHWYISISGKSETPFRRTRLILLDLTDCNEHR
jgi:hypothetical protein